MSLPVDPVRVMDRIQRLAVEANAAELPAVTRVLFTEPDLRGRGMLAAWCREAGLTLRTDPVGNVFARLDGADPSLPAVATGSHVDAIPHSGRYDGVVGVIGGLEAIAAIGASGKRPRRSLELIIFTSEEPTRFGLGCLGSRLMSGALSPERAAALTDAEGATLETVRQAAGCGGTLADVRVPAGRYAAFLELHIEQGPLLEREGRPLGVVTAIAAPATLRMTIEGEGGHAGAVLMPGRKDALCAAAEVILAVERAARGTGAVDTVGTTGLCRVHPGAVNSVPSRVVLEIDIRDIDGARRDGVLAEVRSATDAIASRRGTGVRTEVLNADPPATCGAEVVAAVERAATGLGLPCKRMVSRAYHDSLFMARLCPTGMVFIPCRDGVSHRPDEYSSPEQIAAGTQTLAQALWTLADAP